MVRDGLVAGELLCTTAIPYAIDGITVRPRINGKVHDEARPERESDAKAELPHIHGETP